MPEAVSRGHRIYYETHGFGPPLVLIPGLLMTTRRWELAGYPALANRFQLIMLDTLGHGRSDRPHEATAYNRRAVAADVIAVMDAAGVQSAHVWGYSRGGRIAMDVGSLYPERTRGLIAGGASPMQDRLAANVHERIAALRRDDWDAFWDAMDLPRNASLEAALEAGTEAGALAAIFEASTQPAGFETNLEPFRNRMLIYAGASDLGLQDEAARTAFQEACEALGARVELFDGLDHAEAFQRSDLVMPIVRRFLKDVP